RYSRPLSLVIFDIDHFKKVNDEYGHLAGDHVLRELTRTIRDKVRRHDVIARYGGEEFAVISPEVDLDGGGAFAEKLRALVEHHAFQFEKTEIHVTISVGVGALDTTNNDAPSLVRITDGRL